MGVQQWKNRRNNGRKDGIDRSETMENMRKQWKIQENKQFKTYEKNYPINNYDNNHKFITITDKHLLP